MGGAGVAGYDVTNLGFGGNSAENGGLSRQSSFDLRTKISSEFFLGFNRTCFEKFDSGKKRSYFSLKRDQVDSICIFFCFFVSKMESSMTEIKKYNEAIIFFHKSSSRSSLKLHQFAIKL